jgi:HPt (histidine-containing phosphotransfer) domain-containing protein
MNDKRAQAFAAAFAAIRADYARELPGEVGQLAAAVESARDKDPTALCKGEARAIAHRLYGTAGSYGFTEISEPAAELEALFQTIEDTGSAPADAWATIDGALRRITAALAHLDA